MTNRVLCKYFVNGACSRGDSCPFSHNWKDKPNMACVFYQRGVCSYGDRCRYDHVKPKPSSATAVPAPPPATVPPTQPSFAPSLPSVSPARAAGASALPSASPSRTIPVTNGLVSGYSYAHPSSAAAAMPQYDPALSPEAIFERDASGSSLDGPDWLPRSASDLFDEGLPVMRMSSGGGSGVNQRGNAAVLGFVEREQGGITGPEGGGMRMGGTDQVGGELGSVLQGPQQSVWVEKDSLVSDSLVSDPFGEEELGFECEVEEEEPQQQGVWAAEGGAGFASEEEFEDFVREASDFSAQAAALRIGLIALMDEESPGKPSAAGRFPVDYSAGYDDPGGYAAAYAGYSGYRGNGGYGGYSANAADAANGGSVPALSGNNSSGGGSNSSGYSASLADRLDKPDMPLCTLPRVEAASGACCARGPSCPFPHGDLCPHCGRYCLHPARPTVSVFLCRCAQPPPVLLPALHCISCESLPPLPPLPSPTHPLTLPPRGPLRPLRRYSLHPARPTVSDFLCQPADMPLLPLVFLFIVPTPIPRPASFLTACLPARSSTPQEREEHMTDPIVHSSQQPIHPPTRTLQEREEHVKECMRLQRKVQALKLSSEIECSVCLERVLGKARPADRKFGILSHCDHPFCVACIRNWRAAGQESGESVPLDLDNAVRACPVCRVRSHFVTPSVVWFFSDEEKQAIIEGYKRKLKSTDCRYFKYGNGQCPFGTSCFYKHAYRDGRLEEVKLRHLSSADGSAVISRDI
ncbi:unnamed protein product, partial [Closterium sp. NIES-65]